MTGLSRFGLRGALGATILVASALLSLGQTSSRLFAAGDDATSVTFTIRETSCTNTTFDFSISGQPAGTFSPFSTCSCNPPEQSFTITDPTVLALVGAPACTDFGFTTNTLGYVGVAKVVVDRPSGVETITIVDSTPEWDHSYICQDPTGWSPKNMTNQLPNADGDAAPDCSDPDADNDGLLNVADNCPFVPNVSQIDSDSNGQGDACDPVDRDGDGVWNITDNCPDHANASQVDSDTDGSGDACERNLAAVPWAGVESKPHAVYSGGALVLQASATLAGDSFPLVSGTWDPGDGAGPQSINISNSRILELTHTYTGALGTPFTAVITVQDNLGQVYTDTFKVQIQPDSLDTRANMAIDRALWHNHKIFTLSGDEAFCTSNGSITSACSAGAAQAFQVNGHRQTGDSANNPYVNNVARLLRHLQRHIYRVNINAGGGALGNPDVNGNGYGLEDRADGGSHQVYVGGQIVDAFVASGTPDTVATVGSEAGRTYKDIVQDLMDAYSFGINDQAGQGGWVYRWNDNGGIDSSSSGWWGIGAKGAEVWGVTIPQFVKDHNLNVGIPRLQAGNGSCSYREFGGGGNTAQTAACLVMLSADGQGRSSSQFVAAETFLKNEFPGSAHYDIYAMYGVAKGMRLAIDGSGNSAPITLLGGTIDWYADASNGFGWRLVNNPGPDGELASWGGWADGALANSWGILILSPALFEQGPTAACSVDSNIVCQAGAPGGCNTAGGDVYATVNFDGTASTAGDNPIAGYSWNFQNGGTTVDATTATTSTSFSATGTYNVQLTVTDTKGHSSSVTCPVQVTDTALPPLADAGGPYEICEGKGNVLLDGSASIGRGANIVSYEWDFTVPVNFSPVGATGVTTNQSAYFNSLAPGTYDVGLRVTDDSASQFHTTNFTTVTVKSRNHDDCRNAPPVADSQTVTTAEDTPVGITLTASDPDGNPITYTVGAVSVGTLSGTAPNLTFTPPADFSGTATFTFVVNDGQVDSNVATVTINVTPVNDPPVANPGHFTTPEDTVVSGVVTSSDVDGVAPVYSLTTGPTNGTLILNGDGSLTYTPTLNYTGPDSFTYTVDDGAGGSASAVVTIDVTPVNDPPVANPDAKVTPEETPVGGSLTSTDVDGGAPTYTVATAPAHGSVVVNPDGTYTYTPALNYNGPDSFTYTVNDGEGGTDTETVTITVTSVNDSPVANPDHQTTPEDTAVGGAVTSSDVDGGAPTYTLTTPAAHGTVALGANGVYTYTPNPDYVGPDSFTYTVDDGAGGSASAVVTIDVTPVNDPPVANPDAKVTPEDTSVGGSLTASDIDGGTLVYSLTTGATNGTVVVGSNGVYTYTPNGNYSGPDSFTYTVVDGNGGSDVETVTIQVTPVNDPPVANPGAKTTPEDTAVSGTVTSTDTDGGSPVYSLATGTTHGTVVVAADGSYTYTPAPNYNGPDSFTFTVVDGNGGSATNTVSLTVTPVNDKPVAVDDSYTGQWNTLLTVPVNGVLANDTDVDGDVLSAIKLTNPSAGVLVFNANGGLTFMPAANWSGTTSFTYKANDGALDSNVATVKIRITSPCGNGDDKSSDDKSRDGRSDDRSGKSGKSRDGRSNDGRSDDHSSDDHSNDSGCKPGTPIAHKDHYTTKKNTSLTVAANKGVLKNDNAFSVNAQLVAGASNGTVVLGANGSFLYTPAPGFVGDDFFTYVPRSASGVAGNVVKVTIRVRGHWDGDNCDHDKKKNKHKKGDRCDHDKDHD